MPIENNQKKKKNLGEKTKKPLIACFVFFSDVEIF
jgi:hypothetical protein